MDTGAVEHMTSGANFMRQKAVGKLLVSVSSWNCTVRVSAVLKYGSI